MSTLLLPLLLLATRPAFATAACAGGGSGVGALASGPCSRPEMAQLLLPATGATLMLTNFGVLLPRTSGGQGGAKYELLCEEAFGGKVPARVVIHPDGRLVIPGPDGLYLSADSCGFTLASGSVEGRALIEVAIDPSNPMVIWALGSTPPALHVSRDGGQSFTEQQLFAPDLRLSRLMLGGAGTGAIYVSGYTADHPLALLVSEDAGATFTTRLVARELFARRSTVTELLGLLPTSPPVLLLAAGSPQGPDQIWRSNDSGISWSMTFALLGMEVKSGFAIHPDTGQVFVAGRELFADPGKPPAHLYVSTDGAQSFAEPIPSSAQGPRYRCLEVKGARLYACAGEPGDPFLAAQSDDGGRTWAPVLRLADLEGRRECTGARCIATATWLCQFYGAACEGLGPLDGGNIDDAGRDAGPGADVRAGDHDDQGCGCRIGARAPAEGSLPLALTICLVAFMGRLAGRRRR